MDIQHEKGGFTMRPRMLLPLALAALIGGAVAVLPALAATPSETKLEVNENCVELNWPCWATPGSESPASRITIAPGGEVKFTDHATTAATVVWTGSAPMCSGIPASAMTAWEGTCKFEQEGTYKFESSTLFNEGIINYTKYEVVVESASTGTTTTTTTTTTTPTTTTTTTPTTTAPTATTPTSTTSTQPSSGGATGTTSSTASTPSATETPRPPAGSQPLPTLALANAQRGNAVQGTVQVPAADDGARMEVELLAQGASLAKVKRPGSSRVGRLVRSSVPAGTASFRVSLDAQAKRALRRHHKLTLTVKVVLTPKHGAALTIIRSLELR
jgi:hypothetical protein